MMNNFEKGVIEFLEIHKSGNLYILADFYFECVDLLNLTTETGEYWKNKRKIQYRLNKMREAGLIEVCRIGTGFLGKTDFGMTSINNYSLPQKNSVKKKIS